jgi:hypothetical protein
MPTLHNQEKTWKKKNLVKKTILFTLIRKKIERKKNSIKKSPILHIQEKKHERKIEIKFSKENSEKTINNYKRIKRFFKKYYQRKSKKER